MNAKDQEIIDRFIELRAQGWTLVHISAELNVTKQTLIAWSRRHRHRLSNPRALQTRLICGQYKPSQRACLESLAEDLRRPREELARRDLADIPAARLVLLVNRLRDEASRVAGPLHLAAPVTELEAEQDQFTDPVVTWDL